MEWSCGIITLPAQNESGAILFHLRDGVQNWSCLEVVAAKSITWDRLGACCLAGGGGDARERGGGGDVGTIAHAQVEESHHLHAHLVQV